MFSHFRLVAGYGVCAGDEVTQKFIASWVSFGLFIVLTVGAIFLLRHVAKKKISGTKKAIYLILLGLLAFIVCLGVPLVTLVAMSPLCM